MKRGVHFCLFYRFYILIFSFLRSVHPPHKNALLYVHFRGGARFVIPLFSIFYTHKWAKVHPPLEKLSRKKYSEHERNDIFRSFCVFRVQIYSSLSGPFQVRSRSVPSPFQVRSYEWEVNGTYNGFTTDLLGRYI